MRVISLAQRERERERERERGGGEGGREREGPALQVCEIGRETSVIEAPRTDCTWRRTRVALYIVLFRPAQRRIRVEQMLP